MSTLTKSLGYFSNKNDLDKDEFDEDVWKLEIGPALVFLEKSGLACVIPSLVINF